MIKKLKVHLKEKWLVYLIFLIIFSCIFSYYYINKYEDTTVISNPYIIEYKSQDGSAYHYLWWL